MSSTESEEQRLLRLTEEAAKEREEHIRKSISEVVTQKGPSGTLIFATLAAALVDPSLEVTPVVEEADPGEPTIEGVPSLGTSPVVQEADPGEPTIEEMSIVLQVIEDEETEFQNDGYQTFHPLSIPPPRMPEYTSRSKTPPRITEPRTPEPRKPEPRTPKARNKSPDRPPCCSPLR